MTRQEKLFEIIPKEQLLLYKGVVCICPGDLMLDFTCSADNLSCTECRAAFWNSEMGEVNEEHLCPCCHTNTKMKAFNSNGYSFAECPKCNAQFLIY